MTEPDDRDSLKRQLAASGVFDADWYRWRNQDVAGSGLDPLDHFVDYGQAEARWPNRYFDPAWYRQENPDVASAGVDPLRHYIDNGEREGRRPHPLFSPVWYRHVYGPPDEQLALWHFLAAVKTGQVVPSPDLFPVPLISPYRNDPALGVDPIGHYLDDLGQGEAFPDLQVVRSSGLLDENYYLINAADVLEADIDPVLHYCRFGWRERRKPNIYFDPLWYTYTNPDVARLRINPLVHYILAGEAADRRPVPFFDPGWYRTEYNIPAEHLALGHYLVNRRKQQHSPTPLFDVKWYIARFGSELGPNRDPFAHYLQAGMTQDIDPSRWFNAEKYRRANLGRPSRGFLRMLRPDQHNPLVHFLRAEYEQRQRPG
jgi:hypothetical protein